MPPWTTRWPSASSALFPSLCRAHGIIAGSTSLGVLGAVARLVPVAVRDVGGVLDRPGQPFHDPTADRALKHTASVEFVVSSGRDGGKGTVEFDELAMRALPPQDDSPLKPASVSASSSLPDSPANAAVDGDRQTAWRSDAQKAGEQRFDIDLGKPRELSGIVVHWHHGERATSWQIEQSLDGKAWHSCGGALARSGDTTFAEVCQAGGDARYLRMRLYKGESNTFGIDEIEIKDPAWAATRNAFFGNVAKAAPRGAYPRGFVEQPYWTIVGVDGGSAPALISEDGAIEPRKGGWSIEPFLIVDAARLTWADVTATQSLLDGYLPMPRVQWNTAKLALSIDAFAQGSRAAPQLVARYRVRNLTDAPVDATLQLAIRPFQVNPPAQFLNSPGGVAHVQSLLEAIAARGIAILLVEQKLTIALAISHRLYVMGQGRIVFEGTAHALQESEAVRREWLEV